MTDPGRLNLFPVIAIIAVAAAVCVAAVWLIALWKRRQVADVLPEQGSAFVGEEIVSVGGRRIAIGKAQHIGLRESQQDAFGVSGENGRIVCVVCDGMGGMVKGAESSKLAVKVLMEKAADSQISPEKSITEALTDASREVYALCRGRGGTTAVAAVAEEAGLSYGCVGDSRIYLLRDGELNQLGQDHVFYYDLLKTGLPPSEAANHPESEHLTSFIGREELTKINTSGEPIPLEKGDVILLVTDGVYKTISGGELLAAMQNGAAEEVIYAVLAKGNPMQDNVTAVSLRVLD